MKASAFDNQLQEISRELIDLKESFADQRLVADEHTYSMQAEESLRVWRENLIEIYAQSIYDELDNTFLRLKEWGANVVNLLVNLNLPLELAIEEVRFYRNTMGQVIKEEAVKYNFSIPDFYEVISRFDSVVDRAVYWLSISYSNSYSAKLAAADVNALELSIPIVRVSEEVGVLPLVGDLDTNRASYLMEKALSYGSELRLKYMIIDLSGVPVMDTMVANQIFQVIDALNLIGIETKLTGIRPEIAQTMVSLGISFQDTFTFASLHQAIEKINNQRDKSLQE